MAVFLSAIIRRSIERDRTFHWLLMGAEWSTDYVASELRVGFVVWLAYLVVSVLFLSITRLRPKAAERDS
jgi:hypothetical protein